MRHPCAGEPAAGITGSRRPILGTGVPSSVNGRRGNSLSAPVATAALLGALILAACSKEEPEVDVTGDHPYHFLTPPYAHHLKGLRICLDPGHGGGQAAKNLGPTGLREAEINLAVALYLKEFLSTAGAKVLLTRDSDRAVSLQARAQLANRKNCDFFVSLHHNANEEPSANYTSTWYHDSGAQSLASLDLARHVQTGVGEALVLPRSLPCPLLSDKLRFTDGFAVLRQLEIPGILCEASFYTHPPEEERLKLPSYRRREAHGYFVGITRYVAGGLPKARLSASTRKQLQFELGDGLSQRGGWGAKELHRVPETSISVRLDGLPVPYQYLPKKRQIRVPLRKIPTRVELIYTNIFGNHGWPQLWVLEETPK